MGAPTAATFRLPPWYAAWNRYLAVHGDMLDSRQADAAARLAVVLLAGEQSAISIFGAEVRRRTESAEFAGLSQLIAIERDEFVHELCLRNLCRFLPDTDDAHALKRRAQRFFAGLGRTSDMARHFGQISHLDAAVCKIMWHVERSELPSSSPLKILSTRIKRDEARHVAVSRRHSRRLGLPPAERAVVGEQVQADLAGMLAPLGAAFEDIGVDTDRLFRSITRQPLT